MTGTLAVYEYFLVMYRRLWRASVFSQFIAPLLFVVALGTGVGSFVNRGGSLGVDYLTYLVPGLIASTSMSLAVSESTFPVYGHFAWNRYYFAIQATPVHVGGMIAGQVAFLLTRTLIAGFAFLLVMGALGEVHGVGMLGVVLVGMLLALAVGPATMAFSAWVSSEAYFALLFRFVVAPLTLFSGVFFPVSQLPGWLRPAAYVSPLWHGVELCRSFAYAGFPLGKTLLHVGYLLLLSAAGLYAVRAAFLRRLER
ncbi:ABC transporter permease [Longispora sp. NPDC051575]|uniref:ABC transporter permease n=1 Tax=Longispora sp. NPDC051575 TaxID=3154943 RepID=UPI003445BB37